MINGEVGGIGFTAQGYLIEKQLLVESPKYLHVSCLYVVDVNILFLNGYNDCIKLVHKHTQSITLYLYLIILV